MIGHVRTLSGQVLSLLNPDPNLITLEEIAHRLSMECRWAGACYRFWSVAEHSIAVSEQAAFLAPANLVADCKLHGLLHDAHEAYLKDIPTPIKPLLGDCYKQMVDKVQACIYVALGVSPPSAEVAHYVHLADQHLAWTESRFLTKGPHTGVEPPEPISLFYRPQIWAKEDFIARFQPAR